MASVQNRKPTTATARLKQDYLRLKRDPIPYVTAEPNPSNILEWHYVVSGPENSPYEGGIYHGKLVFPRDFPFKPPSIYILTPNGRFKTNTRLCLSISDFHPDTWNPAWSVSTILTGLLSFMMEKSPTYGSIETTDLEKRQFAFHSLAFNLKDHQFCETFPDVVEKIKEELERRKEAEERLLANGGDSTTETGPRGCATQPHHLTAGGGAVANFCVLIAVAMFVFAVRYVVSNTYIDTQDL